MEPIMAGSGAPRLEGLCAESDWIEEHGQVEGVELLRAWFTGPAYARHRHDTYGIGITELGVQSFEYRGQVEHSRAGQGFVLHPDEPHDGRSGTDGGFGYRIVYLDPARIAAAARALTGRPTALPFARQPVVDDARLARAVADGFAGYPEPLALDELVVRLTECLLDVARVAGPSAEERIDRLAMGRVHEYLGSRPAIVRSAELEGVAGLNRYQIARQFRRLYGTSPYRYSLLRRLDVARALLGAGVPLAELALAAGFADQGHFSRSFKAAYGLPPGRYVTLKRRGAIREPRSSPRSQPVPAPARRPQLRPAE
ncbi:MAG: AraC family transcriptional regulator [Chloroflexi bacterium]|nr:AraC family transcriptional regulator [Chloroflexota bacterium]